MDATIDIKWTSGEEWGYDSKTHWADEAGIKFHIGRVGSYWRLRGWGPGDRFIYREAKTLREAKDLADRILNEGKN